MSEFRPPPDYILMADCIYYEEVKERRAVGSRGGCERGEAKETAAVCPARPPCAA